MSTSRSTLSQSRRLFVTFCQSSGRCLYFGKFEEQDLKGFHNKHHLMHCAHSSSSSGAQTSVTLLKKHALTVLRSTHDLLDRIDDDDYYTPIAKFSNASVGMHFRHSLDHVEKVLSGYTIADTIVNYDRRERKSVIEHDRMYAIEKTAALIDQIDALPEDDFSGNGLQVSFMADSEGQEYVMQSSLIRELSFVAHHATHHLAMVKVMMESLGYDIDDTVGKANSTMQSESSKTTE